MKRTWFVVFADGHGVNTVIMSDFKLLTCFYGAGSGLTNDNFFIKTLKPRMSE